MYSYNLVLKLSDIETIVVLLFRTEDTGSYYCLVNNKESSQDKIKLKVLGKLIHRKVNKIEQKGMTFDHD